MKTNKFLTVVVAIAVIISLMPVMASAHGYGGGYHGGGYHGCGWGHIGVSIGIGVPLYGGYWGPYPYYSYPYPYYPYYPYSPVVVSPMPTVVTTSAPVYTTSIPPAASYVAGVQVPDYDGLIAIGTKMKMQGTVQPITQAATQQQQSLSQADKLVDDGIKAFDSRNYNAAIEKFRTAVRLEPNDTVLPLIYAQALFANNEYEKAAAVVVTTLAEMGPVQQPQIFYPLGMYKDQTLLQGQVKNLERAVSMDPGNADMHLLLGYHYLGIGKLDEAKAAIAPALNDKHTQVPAQIMMTLIEQVKQAAKVSDANSIKK